MALNNKNLFKQRLELVIMQFPIFESKYKMHPMKMSGGERQLLTLAMATLHQPKIILIDEPLIGCLLYTSPSPRDRTRSRMPSSACNKNKKK